MPCRSGSPQAVLSAVDALAVPAGAIFSRTMTARITATTPRTWSSRLRMCTSARVCSLTTPGEDSCQAPLSPNTSKRLRVLFARRHRGQWNDDLDCRPLASALVIGVAGNRQHPAHGHESLAHSDQPEAATRRRPNVVRQIETDPVVSN